MNDDTNIEHVNSNETTVLIIEPFFGGSHKQLIETLINGFSSGPQIVPYYIVSLPAKKWHWRARTSALYISQIIPHNHNIKTIFASSVLNLAELIALRLDLSHTRKVIYFHENQLVYPVRKEKERDFQYGYNQILTCLVADVILFNSKYNQDSFLNSINKFFKLQPDFRPKDLKAQIAPKCRVLYYPIHFPPCISSENTRNTSLHIVWPHRWEHDKDPDTFFEVLFTLLDSGHHFQVSVLGETFSDVPQIFDEAYTRLSSQVVNWGHQETKEKYYEILNCADVVVSTAKHEFYGVAMLEAAYCGCFPLCPNDLVYPEIYPPECLYKSKEQLIKVLEKFCKDPSLSRQMRKNMKLDFMEFSADSLIHEYVKVLYSKDGKNNT